MPNLNSLHSPQKRKVKSKTSSTSSNLKIVGYCITAFAAILIFQIFRWQVIFADKFQDMAQNQYRASRIQIATRGIITASDNTVLAVDEPVWNIYATLSVDEKERELDSLYIEKFYNRLLIPEKTLAIEEKYDLVLHIILDMKRYDEMEINEKRNGNEKRNENKDNEQIKLLKHITTMSENFAKIYNKNSDKGNYY